MYLDVCAPIQKELQWLFQTSYPARLALRLPSPSCLHDLPGADGSVGGLRDRPRRQVHFCSGFLALVWRVKPSPPGNDIGITPLFSVVLLISLFCLALGLLGEHENKRGCTLKACVDFGQREHE